MINLEHPQITEVNIYGHLRCDSVVIIDNCKKCETPISENQTVIEFSNDLYCDEECLIEAFCDSPFNFGAEKIKT